MPENNVVWWQFGGGAREQVEPCERRRGEHEVTVVQRYGGDGATEATPWQHDARGRHWLEARPVADGGPSPYSPSSGSPSVVLVHR